jgi:hypothetical protein
MDCGSAVVAASVAVPTSLGSASVDEVTPTVLPVTIADGRQHVFPEENVCLLVAFL